MDLDKDIEQALVRLGLNIAYYRDLRGLTQDALAEKANLGSKVIISRIESRSTKHNPKMATIMAIAKALDMPLHELVDFEQFHELS